MRETIIGPIEGNSTGTSRYEAVTTDLGWIVVRVTAEDVPGGILRRVAAAWSRRVCSQGEKVA